MKDRVLQYFSINKLFRDKKNILLIIILIILLLTSCSIEKVVRIESVSEFVKELAITYDDVRMIRVTYLERTVIFNVHINPEIAVFDEEDILMDLKNFLRNREIQNEIRDYYIDKAAKKMENRTFPTLRILLTSDNEEYVKHYYELYRELYDDGSGVKKYNYVKEWSRPFYNIGESY